MIARRTLLGAAWATPALVAIVATPAAAASGCATETFVSAPREHDVARITVTTGVAVVFDYVRAVDHHDSNIRVDGHTVNTHGTEPIAAGGQIIVPLAACVDPEWIQVHGNNTHYYGAGVFA